MVKALALSYNISLVCLYVVCSRVINEGRIAGYYIIVPSIHLSFVSQTLTFECEACKDAFWIQYLLHLPAVIVYSNHPKLVGERDMRLINASIRDLAEGLQRGEFTSASLVEASQ